MPGYVPCATPRSGSTLLCGCLERAGAGRPQSCFRAEDLDDRAADRGLPPPVRMIDAACVRAVRAAGTSASGVFGLRLMAETVPTLVAALARLYPGQPDDPGRLGAAFGPLRFVHLHRRDALAQAVSRVRAQQTGLWHVAPDGTVLEQVGAPSPARHDAGQIAAARARIEAGAGFWRDWFARHDIAPLRIICADLAADPPGTLSRLLRALGLPVRAMTEAGPPTRRLADAVSEDWIARFRAQDGA